MKLTATRAGFPLALLVCMVLVFVAPRASATTPVTVVNVADYLTGGAGDYNCTNDVSAKFQAAESARQTQHVDLSIPAGCFLINNATWEIGAPAGSGAGSSGRIYGQGPENTRLHTNANNRLMQVNDLWGGSLSGFTLEGPGKGVGQGLVLAALHANLGTNSIAVSDIKATQFGRCIMFGDDASPGGSAAEIVASNLTAGLCSTGFLFGTWNTLDVTCIRCSAYSSSTGFKDSMSNGQAGQLKWIGGSATNNYNDFQLWGYMESIDDFRSEVTDSTITSPRILIGGAGNATKKISMYLVAGTIAAPVAIQINGNPLVEIEQSLLNGAIAEQSANADSTLDVRQNGIYVPSGTAIIQNPPQRYRAVDNWRSHGMPIDYPAQWFGTTGD